MELHAGGSRSRIGYGLDNTPPEVREGDFRTAGNAADIRHGALIPTAYYTGETFQPAPRQPLDEVLPINSW